jgi:xylulokinase
VPLCTHAGGEAVGALGAARLAWLAVGGNVAETCPAPPVRERYEPDASEAGRLTPRYERYRALYPTLHSLFA